MNDTDIEVALSALMPHGGKIVLDDWPYNDQKGKAHIERAHELLKLAQKLVSDKRMRRTENCWFFNQGEFPTFRLRIGPESLGVYIAASGGERYCASLGMDGELKGGAW